MIWLKDSIDGVADAPGDQEHQTDRVYDPPTVPKIIFDKHDAKNRDSHHEYPNEEIQGVTGISSNAEHSTGITRIGQMEKVLKDR